jgi:hypothetical protein
MIKVNAHLHTPNSFSAFDSIGQALDMAVAEDVKVVGINDFYSTAGYQEWADGCKVRGLYPLFNIELISLNEADQKAGVRSTSPPPPLFPRKFFFFFFSRPCPCIYHWKMTFVPG